MPGWWNAERNRSPELFTVQRAVMCACLVFTLPWFMMPQHQHTLFGRFLPLLVVVCIQSTVTTNLRWKKILALPPRCTHACCLPENIHAQKVQGVPEVDVLRQLPTIRQVRPEPRPAPRGIVREIATAAMVWPHRTRRTPPTSSASFYSRSIPLLQDEDPRPAGRGPSSLWESSKSAPGKKSLCFQGFLRFLLAA